MITVEDLNTHLRDESVVTISRSDPGIAEAAIEAAIVEAKGYMGAYDIDWIFATVGTARNALLLTWLKDIAVWHFVNLCNAGTKMELRLKRYERAVDWFKNLQKGNVSIDLPKKEDPETGDIASEAMPISYNSNEKKIQHF